MKLLNSKYYKDFTQQEIAFGKSFMQKELLQVNASANLRMVFSIAWLDFQNGKFSYDGATFVKERSEYTIFEVPAFIHDWRNSNGYVGLKIDDEMFSLMSYLGYPPHLFITRARWTVLTFLNWLRHKYILKDLKKDNPHNLFIIT